MRAYLRSAILSSFLFVFPLMVRAQMVQDFKPAKSNCCLASTAQNLADQLQDWNQLGRYHDDNERLKSQPDDAGRVVFLGDSITDGWKLQQYFPGKPYVNRGISGQTTPQMLVRIYQDVINLHPAVVIILAGTNDIARNTGPETAEMIQDNFKAICELLQKHNIAVVFCSVTPISDYASRKQSVQRPPSDILVLNEWLKKYAEQVHAIYADYFGALADSSGFLREAYSGDGLHPNDKGYALMAPIAQAAIDKAASAK
jgi:lysophospholipase L1-like esterase